MIINVSESKNVLKIKYKSKGKKYKDLIDGKKDFDIDENSVFTLIKYDYNFDDKKKIILYSFRMVFLSIILMIIDNFGDIQNNNSFCYIKYKFKCDSNYVINGNDLDNEKFIKKYQFDTYFNIIYLIL